MPAAEANWTSPQDKNEVAIITEYQAPIGPTDPIEDVRFRTEQQGRAAKYLEPHIGSSGRVSRVLNRKRALSPRMVKRRREGLRISYDVAADLKLVAGSRCETGFSS